MALLSCLKQSCDNVSFVWFCDENRCSSAQEVMHFVLTFCLENTEEKLKVVSERNSVEENVEEFSLDKPQHET